MCQELEGLFLLNIGKPIGKETLQIVPTIFHDGRSETP